MGNQINYYPGCGNEACDKYCPNCGCKMIAKATESAAPSGQAELPGCVALNGREPLYPDELVQYMIDHKAFERFVCLLKQASWCNAESLDKVVKQSYDFVRDKM